LVVPKSSEVARADGDEVGRQRTWEFKSSLKTCLKDWRRPAEFVPAWQLPCRDPVVREEITDPVVMALRAALVTGEAPALRIALGQRLLHLGKPAEALAELERALTAEPANQDGLEAAVAAANAAGDRARADAYFMALSAHRGTVSARAAATGNAATPALAERSVADGPPPDVPPRDAPTGGPVTTLDGIGQGRPPLRLVTADETVESADLREGDRRSADSTTSSSGCTGRSCCP